MKEIYFRIIEEHEDGPLQHIVKAENIKKALTKCEEHGIIPIMIEPTDIVEVF